MRFILIICTLFIATILSEENINTFTQDEIFEEENLRNSKINQYSMGFDFMEDLQTGFYLSSESKGLRFEVFGGYMSEFEEYEFDDSDYDYEILDTWMLMKFGVFKTYQQSNKISSYVGLRLGKIWYSWEIDGGEIEEEDAERNITIISPAFGIEYHISDYFSFGADVEFLNTIEEYEIEDYWSGDIDKITTSRQIIPKFIVRFYL